MTVKEFFLGKSVITEDDVITSIRSLQNIQEGIVLSALLQLTPERRKHVIGIITRFNEDPDRTTVILKSLLAKQRERIDMAVQRAEELKKHTITAIAPMGMIQ